MHLAVTMRRLEEVLLEVESVLGPDWQEGIMAVYEHDIPPSLAPKILVEIQHLRSDIRGVKRHYQLSVETMSDRRRLVAKLSLLSVDLEGSNSRHMTGYGDLDEKERKPLDDYVNRMIEAVNRIREVIGAINLVSDRPPRSPRNDGD